MGRNLSLWMLFGCMACGTLDRSDSDDQDLDGDGFSAQMDCNDQDPSVYPGAPETCDLPLRDTNCDGHVGGDDSDADGFRACEDCNDGDEEIYPGSNEICDGVDNDCDGFIDDEDPSLLQQTGTARYVDSDGDGFGDESLTLKTCAPVDGFVEQPGDCDDADGTIHPEATEICDGRDNDCDTLVDSDDDVTLMETDPICFTDDDKDGYGEIGDGLHTCACDEGESEVSGDCDDGDWDVHPDSDFFATPTRYGHFDYNCDSVEEHHYDLQGQCELDKTGEACTFQAGWVMGTPPCGEISGVITACTFTTGKGTKPASGTSGGGSTGGTSSGTATCEPTMAYEQALCR